MCPNIGECWEEREATFLLLGARCTRRCGFCDVTTGKPDPVDDGEPKRIAETVRAMGLRHVVLTGVARDDLPDGGALDLGARRSGRAARPSPGIEVEVLPSDFKGGERDIATVLDAGPAVFAHNLETVPRLHATDPARVRLRAVARGAPLRQAAPPGTGHEVQPDPRDGRAPRRGRATRCATSANAGRRHPHDGPVPAADDPPPAGRPLGRARGVRGPRAHGEAMGIAHVEAGPLVRSSYHAGRQLARAVAAGVAVS